MTDTHPDLSVLVCTYRCELFIDSCLAAVKANTVDHQIEIIVSDNDSDDGTVAAVRRLHPDVRVIEMGSNAGFAAANNAALAVARGRHVILLNPDTVVEHRALDLLVETLDSRDDVGVVAPQLLGLDGRDQGTARSFPTPAAALFGRRSPLTRLAPDNRWSTRFLVGRSHSGDEPFPVDWVSGACLMARRDDLAELGGLDEGFFMHFEDTDLCHRMKGTGKGVLCVPEAKVVHAEGGCRRGWSPSQVRHFHYGAYRYWTKHNAPEPWNPLRLVAALLLGLRAVAVVAIVGARSHLTARPVRTTRQTPGSELRSSGAPSTAGIHLREPHTSGMEP